MKATQELVDRLNDALALEMRAQAMYAHYAAYVTGIHRMHLKPYFENEAAESVIHAQTVSNALVRFGLHKRASPSVHDAAWHWSVARQRCL